MNQHDDVCPNCGHRHHCYAFTVCEPFAEFLESQADRPYQADATVVIHDDGAAS
jgi:hypothetical protein